MTKKSILYFEFDIQPNPGGYRTCKISYLVHHKLQESFTLYTKIREIKTVSHSTRLFRLAMNQPPFGKPKNKPEPGSWRNAKGLFPWKPGDEPAEDTIRRLRDEEEICYACGGTGEGISGTDCPLCDGTGKPPKVTK